MIPQSIQLPDITMSFLTKVTIKLTELLFDGYKAQRCVVSLQSSVSVLWVAQGGWYFFTSLPFTTFRVANSVVYGKNCGVYGCFTSFSYQENESFLCIESWAGSVLLGEDTILAREAVEEAVVEDFVGDAESTF